MAAPAASPPRSSAMASGMPGGGVAAGFEAPMETAPAASSAVNARWPQPRSRRVPSGDRRRGIALPPQAGAGTGAAQPTLRLAVAMGYQEIAETVAQGGGAHADAVVDAKGQDLRRARRLAR